MKIFSKYKNLSSEKTLIQQFNALNQEMDLLKLQLTKINQLLNDTIAEKCKQELKHNQQQFDLKNKKTKNDLESLFRADLVPTGNTSIIATSSQLQNETMKLNTPVKNNNCNSIENLTNNQRNSTQNYSQLLTPKSSQNTKNYNPNHHYYCLNNNDSYTKPTSNLKLDNNISKSIDSIYTPPSSLNNINNNTKNNTSNNLTSSLSN